MSLWEAREQGGQEAARRTRMRSARGDSRRCLALVLAWGPRCPSRISEARLLVCRVLSRWAEGEFAPRHGCPPLPRGKSRGRDLDDGALREAFGSTPLGKKS